MKNLLAKIVMCFAVLLLIAGCGTQGTVTTTPPASVIDSGVAILGLTSDKDTINSDGVDISTLTVRALDANNAAVEGVTVSLSTTAGALSKGSVITDAGGAATFTIDSGVETNNQVVTVTASANTAVATKAISILGTTVSFTSDKTSVGLNGASTATLTVLVRDGSDNPVENVSATLTSVLGTINGSSSINLITDTSGKATATYVGGTTAGNDTISLSGPGTGSLSMVISGQQFFLADTQAGSFSITASDTITLTWIDGAGSPVSGTDVQFSATKGTFGATGNNFVTGATDAAGHVSAVFSPTAVGQDTITVSGGGLAEILKIVILADTPNSVSLNINPSVVSRAQGGVTPTASVSATVLDSLNRAVQGVDVAFSLTSGPGGGESVSPAIAMTNSAGIATTTFSSGGLISSQDGVSVLAKVVSAPTITDAATLTIADQAATIVIGETNKIQALTIGSTDTAYAMPFTVLVTDTNGSAIANQTVSLSLYPTQFRTGGFIDNTNFDTFLPTATIANEDVNRNGNLDAGEDAVVGIFANGRLDPGGVASIPVSVTTDSNGFAGFDVIYAKSFALWVDVEISATTNVSGSESKSILTTPLKVLLSDAPFLDSPFGP